MKKIFSILGLIALSTSYICEVHATPEDAFAQALQKQIADDQPQIEAARKAEAQNEGYDPRVLGSAMFQNGGNVVITSFQKLCHGSYHDAFILDPNGNLFNVMCYQLAPDKIDFEVGFRVNRGTQLLQPFSMDYSQMTFTPNGVRVLHQLNDSH